MSFEIFFFPIFLSLFLLITFLSYISFRNKNKLNECFSKTLQMEKIKDKDFEYLEKYKNKSFKGKKLWFFYFILENRESKFFLDRIKYDINSKLLFLRSACILYISKFKIEEFSELIFPCLKSENIILRLHSIYALKEIFASNFDIFKNKFEKYPTKLLDVSLLLFDKLERGKKKELFILIKKYFYKNEDAILKTLVYIDDFFEESDYEELLYQLDVFPLSFQEKFITIFSKKMEISNYINYFNFKFKTLTKELRYIYIFPLAKYYSDLDIKEVKEFINNLEDKEIEIFFKEYFPDPNNFISLLKLLNREFSFQTYEIILEKLSLLRYENSQEVLESLIMKTEQRDKLLFKFSNLVLDWKKEEMAPILFWLLTKIENPVYRNKINDFIKEMKLDN